MMIQTCALHQIKMCQLTLSVDSTSNAQERHFLVQQQECHNLQLKKSAKQSKKQNLSLTKKSNPNVASNLSTSTERVQGRPNGDFLKRYGLNEHSHLMD